MAEIAVCCECRCVDYTCHWQQFLKDMSTHESDITTMMEARDALNDFCSNCKIIFVADNPDDVAGSTIHFLHQRWDKVPSHYGGGNWEIDLHMSFLPRVRTLPPPKKLKIRKSPRAEALFKKLFHGDFVCKIQRMEPRRLAHGSGIPIISFKIAVFESIESPGPLMIISIDSSNNNLIGIRFDNANEEYSFFKQAIRSEEQHYLRARMFHIILRRHGALIPSDLATCMKEELLSSFSRAKDFDALLDVNVCFADILASTKNVHSRDVANAFLDSGNACIAVGKLQTAAIVYERATYIISDDARMQCHLWESACVAWDKADQYTKAEQAYYCALQLHFIRHDNKFPLEDEDFHALALHVLHFYSAVFHSPKESTRPMNDMEMREVVFTTLFQRAGYRVKNNGGFLFARVHLRIPVIKPQFLTPVGAQLALTVAIRKPTFEGYCRHLLKCLKENNNLMTDRNLEDQLTIEIVEFRNAKRKSLIEDIAHELEVRMYKTQVESGICYNPGCPKPSQMEEKGSLQHCKCKATHYCSDECQEAHWHNGHKEHCTSRKKCDNPSCGAMEEELADFLRCKGCNSSYYCSPKCYQAHWKMGHKEECRRKAKRIPK